MTRHEGCDGEGEDIEVCSDPGALVERYEHSQEEPVVVGGLELFEFFTLNAWRVDIVWSNEITPDQVE